MWLLANFYPILMRPRGLSVLVLCLAGRCKIACNSNTKKATRKTPLLQASNEASQASGAYRASHGPPSGETRRGTSTDRAAGDALEQTSRRWRDGHAPQAQRRRRPDLPPRNENNYTYRENASSAGESSCSACADGDISIAKYVSQK